MWNNDVPRRAILVDFPVALQKPVKLISGRSCACTAALYAFLIQESTLLPPFSASAAAWKQAKASLCMRFLNVIGGITLDFMHKLDINTITSVIRTTISIAGSLFAMVSSNRRKSSRVTRGLRLKFKPYASSTCVGDDSCRLLEFMRDSKTSNLLAKYSPSSRTSSGNLTSITSRIQML